LNLVEGHVTGIGKHKALQKKSATAAAGGCVHDADYASLQGTFFV
jgi:hypothetical protein